MNKRVIAAIASAFVILVGLIGIFLATRKGYEVFLILENEGVAVSGEEMTRYLMDNKQNEEGTTAPDVSGQSFAMSETVYTKKGKLFLGEEKHTMSSAYPLFVNNGNAIFCLTDTLLAVTEDFDYVPTYQGLYISGGISFNEDMERAYREDFLFAKMINGLYINTMEMTVNKSALPGKSVETNSILSFRETELRMYSLSDAGVFEYSVIEGLNNDSKVTINGVTYGYYDLLEKLGLYEKNDLYEDIIATPEPEATPTEPVNIKPTKPATPTPEPSDAPEVTPLPTEEPFVTVTVTNAVIGQTEVTKRPTPDMERPGSVTPVSTPKAPTQTPTPTIAPTKAPTATTAPAIRPTREPRPTQVAPGQVPVPTAEPMQTPTMVPTPTSTPTPTPTMVPTKKPTQTPTLTPTPTNTPTPMPTPTEEPMPTAGVKPTKVPSEHTRVTVTPKPTLTPKPAATAAPAPTVPLEEEPPIELPPVEEPEEDPLPPKQEPIIWKKPEVTIGQFESLVYSVKNEYIQVTNSEYLHKSGVAFEVYDKETGKLTSRRAFTGSEDNITVTGLKPQTEYRVVISMTYLDSKGNRVTEKIGEDTFTTKEVSSLPEMHMNWTNSTTLYNRKAELLSIQQTDVPENNFFYDDMVSHIAKLEIEFVNQKKSLKFALSQKLLNAFKKQESIDYITSEILSTNTRYDYNFALYDKYGNRFKIAEPYRGQINTCKNDPKALVTVKKNEVRNIELEITINNADEATLANTYFVVLDKNGNEIETSYYYGKNYKEYESARTYHLLKQEERDTKEEKYQIRFADLLDFEVYNIEIRSDYDIADKLYPNMREDVLIGKTKIVTASISSLGLAYFKVEFSDITSKSANVKVTLDQARTNPLLTSLMSEYDVTFVKNSANPEEITSEGIKVAYISIEDPALAGPDDEDSTEPSDGEEQPGETGSSDTGADENPDETPDEGGEGEDPAGTKNYIYKTAENGQVVLSEYELADTICGEGVTFRLSDLESMSEYCIQIVPKVVMGSGEYSMVRTIGSLVQPDRFKTRRKTPVIRIDAAYANLGTITLFKVDVDDPDEAITGYPVNIRVFDEEGNNVALAPEDAVIAKGEQKAEIRLEGLKKYTKYTFCFFASRFNDSVGYEKAYEFDNYELYYSELAEEKERLVIETGEAVYGDLNFEGLNAQKIENNRKHYIPVVQTNNEIQPYAYQMTDATTAYTMITSKNAAKLKLEKNGTLNRYWYRNYGDASATLYRSVYKIESDFGEGDYNSFAIEYTSWNPVRPVTFKLYHEDPVANPGAKVLGSFVMNQTTFATSYAGWTDRYVFTSEERLNGQDTVYLVEERYGSYASEMPILLGIEFADITLVEDELESLYANIHVKVSDIKSQLGEGSTASYKLTIYENDALLDVLEHRYSLDDSRLQKSVQVYRLLGEEEPKYLETLDYTTDQERTCDVNFFYEVDRYGAMGKQYHVVLSTVVLGHEIVLDEIYFRSEEIVKAIRNKEEFRMMQNDPKGSYIAINDIDLSTWNYGTTMPSSVIFDAHLDFQGHLLTINNAEPPIYTIGTQGVVENIRVTYADTFDNYTMTMVARENYGTIRNVVIERNNLNQKSPATYKDYSSGIVYINMTGGVIENFVVHIVNEWYASQHFGGVAGQNYGTIRNGYVYGCDVIETESKYLNETQKSAALRWGGITSLNYASGEIENCYTLINLHRSRDYHTDDTFNLIGGYNRGGVKNCLSVGDVLYNNNGKLTIQANANPMNSLRTENSGIPRQSNMYLYSEQNYIENDTMPQKVSRLILHDYSWFEWLFNHPTNSKTDQFRTYLVKQGFYPQVEMPECMDPYQPRIYLPELATIYETDITSVEVIEQNLDTARAIVTFYNPDRFEISAIRIPNLKVTVLSQYAEGVYWRVLIEVSNPTRYLSEYYVTGFDTFRFSRNYPDESYYKKAGFVFYKGIYSVADFFEIRMDLAQNYRMYADIDLLGYPASMISINGNFTGKLDGNGYKLENIDVSDTGYVFQHLYGGIIRDLTVENLIIDVPANTLPGVNRGFIQTLQNDGLIDGVHIRGAKLVSTHYTGALVGYVYNGRNKIQNCSVHDIVITSRQKGNNTQYVGGMVGYSFSVNEFRNCYADRVNIEIHDAFDCGGTGGMFGGVCHSNVIENVYVIRSKVNSNFRRTGGLIGAELYRESANGYVLNNFYVDAEVSSLTDCIGGIIGYAHNRNLTSNVNGLFLGSVYNINEEYEYVGRYIGQQNYTTGLASDGLYTLQESSFVNGRLNLPESRDDSEAGPKAKYKDFFQYLSYAQVTDPNFYDKGVILGGKYYNLDLGSAFAQTYQNESDETVYYAAQGKLPLLYATDGVTLLPYQENMDIQNEDIRVSGMKAENYSGEFYEVKIKVEHPVDYEIINAVFDEHTSIATLSGEQNPKIVTIDNGDGTATTELSYVLVYNGYFDRYYLTGFNFKKSAEAAAEPSDFYLDTTIPAQFLEIANAMEWREKMSIHGRKGYNIRITGDLDFTQISDYTQEVIVNRIHGQYSDESMWPVITLNKTTPTVLVSLAYGSISKLKFENIDIRQTGAHVDYYGIILRQYGSIYDISLKNVKITADEAYHVAPFCIAYGENRKIKMDGVYVQVRGKRSGPDSGCLIACMNGAATLSYVDAQNIFNDSNDHEYAGGLVGRQQDASKFDHITLKNFAVLGYNNYTGGIVGYCLASTYGVVVNNILIENGFVSGGAYVGGLCGAGRVYNSSYNTKADITIRDTLVIGAGARVGGVVGYGDAYNEIFADKLEIFGADTYIGGIVGLGSASNAYVTDSLITTVYDRYEGSSTNDIYQERVNNRKDRYVAAQSAAGVTETEKEFYARAAALLAERADAKTSQVRNNFTNWRTTVPEKERIGGISGRGISCEGCVVLNSSVGGCNSVHAGGIIGSLYGEGYGNHGSGVRTCASINTEVKALRAAGGLVGGAERYSIYDSYSNADVRVTGSEGIAGGILGELQKLQSGVDVSQSPRVYGTYFAGSVSATDFVGGMIGKCSSYLYSTNTGFVMLGSLDAQAQGAVISIVGNKQSGDISEFTNVMVYKNSIIHVYNTEMTAEEYYNNYYPEKKAVDQPVMVDSAELAEAVTYSGDATHPVKMVGNATYWNYNGLENGYMPYVTLYACYGNNDHGKSLAMHQEGYQTVNGQKVYDYQKYQGGIPIPGFVKGQTMSEMMLFSRMIRPMMLLEEEPEKIPELKAYCAGVDTLNLEFSESNPEATVEIFANGTSVGTTNLKYRTISVAYDYRTELVVVVTLGTQKQTQSIYPADVSKDVMVWGNDYFYVTAEGVSGSRPTVYGTFVNLCKGMALSADGRKYDVTTGDEVTRFDKIRILEREVPILHAEYEGRDISVFDGYSLSNTTMREAMRLFVKDGSLYPMDSTLYVQADNIVITKKSYGDYIAVLNNKKIVNMTNQELVFPKEFANDQIVQMSNNLFSDRSIVLVRYSDGAVCGFDFITGELLVKTVRGGAVVEGGGKKPVKNSAPAPVLESYENAKVFESNLNYTGWASVPGMSYENGQAVYSDENGNKENGDNLTGGTHESTETENGTNTENGTGDGNGTNTENGTGDGNGTNTENGTGDGNGTNTENGTGDGNGTNTENGTGDGNGTNTENGTGDGNGTNTESGTGDGNGTNTENGTGDGNGTNTESGTGDGNGTNTESGIGDGNGTNTENGTGDGQGSEGSMTPTKGACSQSPEATKAPEPTKGAGSQSPEATKAPEPTKGAGGQSPEATKAPEPTKGAGSQSPEATKAPEPTKSAGSQSPEVTKTPEATKAPEPTKNPAQGIDKTPQNGQNEEDNEPITEVVDITTKKTEVSKYVTFFDAAKQEYVVYDESELLDLPENKLVSMDEKVKSSGHMIDRHNPYVMETMKSKDSNKQGIILQLFTVLGVISLLGVLGVVIYKHRNGGERHEEN